MPVDKKMNILVVDDYHTMRRIVKNLLRQLGFDHVDDATHGGEALEKLRGGKTYGLIISDWNMDPMTGLELLEAVRADAKLKHIPFIMATSESKPENILAAKKAGVSGYVIKPFNAETLKGKITAALGTL